MEIRILGASGGVAQDYRTTSILIDGSILIDAGTGVADLTVEEMTQIRHIFLTHSHFDHIATLPLLGDTVFDRIPEPILIHARSETIEALKVHIFNEIIWPDFTRLPNAENPILKYAPMQPGETLEVGGHQVEMIPVNHIVPGVGYRVENGSGRAFAFSGDTTTNDTFWEALNAHDSLDILLVEAAFANKNRSLSQRSGHYCPSLLAEDLAKLRHHPKIFISHPKPGEEETILAECRELIDHPHLAGLTRDSQFTL